MTTGADQPPAGVAGGAAARAGGPSDAILGVVPRQVAEPGDAASVAAALQACAANGQSVVIRGGGTRLEWGRVPRPIDVLLDMRRLDGIVRYEPGDLTVSVRAGARIADLNRTLADHRQWLPIDAPAAGASIGGAVATNDHGPLRHRYGSMRDQLIGITLATTGGRLASAGGNVVKNVAGYDLGKFVSGSFGSLAAIVQATFKLAPVPAAVDTLVIACPDTTTLGRVAQSLASSQLDVMCLEVMAAAAPDGRIACEVLVRFGGVRAVNLAQMDRARALAHEAGAARAEHAAGPDEAARWAELGRGAWNGGNAAVRASWMPAAIGDVAALVQSTARVTGARMELAGRAALGVGTVHLDGEPPAIVAAIGSLRAARELLHHVVLVRAAPAVREQTEVWIAPGSAARVLAAIKSAMDPAGSLNAGRGPI